MSASQTSNAPVTPAVLHGPTLRQVVAFFVEMGYGQELLNPNNLLWAGRAVAERMREQGAMAPQKCTRQIDGKMHAVNQYQIDDAPLLFGIVRGVLDELLGHLKRNADHAALVEETTVARHRDLHTLLEKHPDALNCDCSWCCPDSGGYPDDFGEDNPSDNDAPTDPTDDRGSFRHDQLVAEKARRVRLLNRQNSVMRVVQESSGSGRKRRSMRSSRRQRAYNGPV